MLVFGNPRLWLAVNSQSNHTLHFDAVSSK
jgi:hypothetical protein